MATWRCTNCGTPQADGSRCWVCSRSPMTCSTCRNFRTGVAANIGFCAVDRAHDPLTGDEIRACWQPPIQAEPVVGLFAMVEALQSAEAAADPRATPPPAEAAGGHRWLSWVPAVSRAPERPLPSVPSPRDADRAALSAREEGTGTPRAARPVMRETPLAAGRAVGRLVEAPLVTPALRLGFRGDARSQREAAENAPIVPAVPAAQPHAPFSATEPSFHAEGFEPLEGGPVL